MTLSSRNCSTISRFNAQTRQRLTDIVVKGLRSPLDIVACDRTSQLYVADKMKCVWRVSSDGADIRRWQPKCGMLTSMKRWLSKSPSLKPLSLTVTSARLLVTTIHFQLIQFDAVGDELRRIQLPNDMRPWHAVESPTGTFIVSRCNSQVDPSDVIEVNNGGEVLRQFSGSHLSSLSCTTRCRWLSRILYWLIPKTTKLYSCNFVIRMLYKHSYWLYFIVHSLTVLITFILLLSYIVQVAFWQFDIKRRWWRWWWTITIVVFCCSTITWHYVASS